MAAAGRPRLPLISVRAHASGDKLDASRVPPVPHGFRYRPVPSVGDIGALLESYAAKRCGVHRGVERGGAVTYGTNAHRAREVLASGRPLRPPPKRRVPRRRPPSMHSSLRLASPKAIEATWEKDDDRRFADGHGLPS